jgi:hypothetical protein
MATEVEQIHTLPAKAQEFGGWLLLVGFWVFVSPFTIGYSLFADLLPFFLSPAWSNLTNPESSSYVPFFANFLMFKALLNVVLFVMSLLEVYLFVRKKRIFPKFFAAFCFFGIVFALFHALAWTSLFPQVSFGDALSDSGFSSWLEGMVIWTPYLFISERSQKTFIM